MQGQTGDIRCAFTFFLPPHTFIPSPPFPYSALFHLPVFSELVVVEISLLFIPSSIPLPPVPYITCQFSRSWLSWRLEISLLLFIPSSIPSPLHQLFGG